MTDSKTCNRCGETKPLDHFSKDKSNKRDGRQRRCKACSRAYYQYNRDRLAAYQREYYAANRDAIRAQHKTYYESNREAAIARAREWSARNPRSRSEYQRLWKEANPDKVAAMNRAWKEANRDRINALTRARYDASRDEMRAYQRARYAKNPGMHWKYSYSARARAFGFDPVVEDFTYDDVTSRYGDACFYCESGAFDHLDHYVPVSSGGEHTLENVRPSCAQCNSVKGNTDGDAWHAECERIDSLTTDELEAAIEAEIERWTD